MIQKNKILTAVLMAGILSVVSLSGSGVTRAESVQTGQTEKKVIGASFASGEASYQETLGTLLEEWAKADSDQYSLEIQYADWNIYGIYFYLCRRQYVRRSGSGGATDSGMP